MGQLHLDSSIGELKYLASKTILIFSDTHLARIFTGFMKLFSFGCSSLFSGEINPYCSRMSHNLFTWVVAFVSQYPKFSRGDFKW